MCIHMACGDGKLEPEVFMDVCSGVIKWKYMVEVYGGSINALD